MKYQELYSNRLNLIKPLQLHVEDLFLIRSNNLINKFIQREKPKTKEDVIHFIHTISTNLKTDKAYYWCIQEKNYKNIIGTICLWNFSEDKKTAEVGYELHPKYQGKGIMSEALNAVLEFAFHELKLESIEAFTHKENNNSVKLLLKHQFTHEVEKKDKNNENNFIFELKKDRFLL